MIINLIAMSDLYFLFLNYLSTSIATAILAK